MDATVNPSKISQAISASFKKYVDREGVAWRFVTDQFIDTYWEEFKKGFRWELPLTEERVYELWKIRAADRYKDWVSHMKRKRPRVGRPPYIPEDIWSHWCAYWDSNEFKERSEKAKKNRLSEPDGPGTGHGRHKGGSRSAVAYSYSLARENGIPMGQTVVPTFRKLHYNQEKDTYTSQKAKRIYEEYEAQIADLSQGLPEGVEPTPTDHAGIFVGIAQNPMKHRIFGLGSLYQPDRIGFPYASGPSLTSTFAGSSRDENVQARLLAAEEGRQKVEGELASLKEDFLEFQKKYEAQQEENRVQQSIIRRLLLEHDTPES